MLTMMPGMLNGSSLTPTSACNMKKYKICIDGLYFGEVYASSFEEVQAKFGPLCRKTLEIIG